LNETRKAALKTLDEEECRHCENNPESIEYRWWHRENPRFSERYLFKCGFKAKGDDGQQKLAVFQKEAES
jgi:hypothetical protein